MECQYIMRSKCQKGHPQSWKCCKRAPATCEKCDREARLAEEKRKKEFELQQKRDAAQAAYAQKLAAIDAEIAAKNLEAQDARVEVERSRTIQQKEKDLEDAKTRLARAAASSTQPGSMINTLSPSVATLPVSVSGQKPSPTQSGSPSQSSPNKPSEAAGLPGRSNVLEIPISPSRDLWQRQKDLEGADNEAIDAIMEMIGLEEVKSQVLDIKAKIDTAVRQNASLKDERFNITFLGNPGTGISLYTYIP
jgi:hypothetical protein